jgi:hypothetical protein
MENEHVLSGLIRKHAELSGQAGALRLRLVQIGTDIDHLGAVIRLFDPDCDLASVRPKRPRGPDVARPGEMSRFVLGVLRGAMEPMPTPAIAGRLMAERGLDGQDLRRVRDMTKRVGMALRHQEQRGTVRSQPGVGRVLLWEVA